MPQLIPVKKGTFEPVRVVLDNGEQLTVDGKAAEFSRRQAKRLACYPRRLKAWLAEKGHGKKQLAEKGHGKKQLAEKGHGKKQLASSKEK